MNIPFIVLGLGRMKTPNFPQVGLVTHEFTMTGLTLKKFFILFATSFVTLYCSGTFIKTKFWLFKSCVFFVHLFFKWGPSLCDTFLLGFVLTFFNRQLFFHVNKRLNPKLCPDLYGT